MYFIRLRFITLFFFCPAAKKIAKLQSFANCHGSISLNVYACILLERGIYTCTLLACALRI